MIIHKYNGCGNSFIVMDYKEGIDYSRFAAKWCGSDHFDTDGLIAVKTQPLEMIYYNKDGSRAPMCGNGIRCFACYVWEQDIVKTLRFDVQTLAGTIPIEILEQEPFYCVAQMGRPDYTTKNLGVAQSDLVIDQTVMIDEEAIQITSLFMGTIHTVVFVDSAQAELKKDLGEKLCHHPMFKEKTNVNFVQVVNETEIIVRTYERGVGWTLACGTGCCAAYVVAKDHGYLPKNKVIVHLEQGKLVITGDQQIQMMGPAIREWSKELE